MLTIFSMVFGAFVSVGVGWVAAQGSRRLLTRHLDVLPSLPSYVDAILALDADADAIRYHAAVQVQGVPMWNRATTAPFVPRRARRSPMSPT